MKKKLLNLVFGEGDSRRGVAVFFLARRHGPEAVFRKRAATAAVHELGHTYGLSHCEDPHCVMWFSDTLAETDRKATDSAPGTPGSSPACVRLRRGGEFDSRVVQAR